MPQSRYHDPSSRIIRVLRPFVTISIAAFCFHWMRSASKSTTNEHIFPDIYQQIIQSIDLHVTGTFQGTQPFSFRHVGQHVHNLIEKLVSSSGSKEATYTTSSTMLPLASTAPHATLQRSFGLLSTAHLLRLVFLRSPRKGSTATLVSNQTDGYCSRCRGCYPSASFFSVVRRQRGMGIMGAKEEKVFESRL